MDGLVPVELWFFLRANMSTFLKANQLDFFCLPPYEIFMLSSFFYCWGKSRRGWDQIRLMIWIILFIVVWILPSSKKSWIIDLPRFCLWKMESVGSIKLECSLQPKYRWRLYNWWCTRWVKVHGNTWKRYKEYSFPFHQWFYCFQNHKFW